jgi:hypothetical protein
MTVEGPATPARPNFSLREAADVCGVSKITMRRPTTPNGSQAASAPLSSTLNAPQPGQLDLQKEVDRLRADLLAETHRRELAETLAAEQGRHLADLRTALNMLNPAPRKRWFRRS